MSSCSFASHGVNSPCNNTYPIKTDSEKTISSEGEELLTPYTEVSDAEREKIDDMHNAITKQLCSDRRFSGLFRLSNHSNIQKLCEKAVSEWQAIKSPGERAVVNECAKVQYKNLVPRLKKIGLHETERCTQLYIKSFLFLNSIDLVKKVQDTSLTYFQNLLVIQDSTSGNVMR